MIMHNVGHRLSDVIFWGSLGGEIFITSAGVLPSKYFREDSSWFVFPLGR